MTNLPLKIYHHNLENKHLLGAVITNIEQYLVEKNYTVGRFKTLELSASDNEKIVLISVSIYRRKTHWTLYIKECEN